MSAFTTIKAALAYIGGMSKPSKLPCHSYSTPAQACRIGSKLVKKEGTVCANCYALKGFYHMFAKTVYPALLKRLKAMRAPLWSDAVSFIVTARKMEFFRWFDSGDLQSVQDLRNIVKVAIACPGCKFWLPTKEYGIVSDFVKLHGPIPKNLIVRLSAYLVDGPPPAALAKRLGVKMSEVSAQGRETCPAPLQDNQCKDCRACWSEAPSIIYRNH